MRAAVELCAFTGLSLLAALALWPLPPAGGGIASGAHGAESATTLVASSAAAAAVALWERAPSPPTAPAAAPVPPVVARSSSAPARSQRPVSFPTAAALAPMRPAPPGADRPPEAHPAPPSMTLSPDSAPRPKLRPAVRPKAPSRRQAQKTPAPLPPAPESVATRAAGAGGGARTGRAQTDDAAARLDARARQTLMARWGAEIRLHIARNVPRGAGRGETLLRLSVAASGALVGVSLARSSGNAGIDALALDAVRRAGRFAPAPSGLGAGPHVFALPVASR